MGNTELYMCLWVKVQSISFEEELLSFLSIIIQLVPWVSWLSNLSIRPAVSGWWSMCLNQFMPCWASFEMPILIRSNAVYRTPYSVITDGAGRGFLGRKAIMYYSEYTSPQWGKCWLPSMMGGAQCNPLASGSYLGCPLGNDGMSGAQFSCQVKHPTTLIGKPWLGQVMGLSPHLVRIPAMTATLYTAH